MIKIDFDSVLFGDGNGKVEGSFAIKGPADTLVYEIYVILKKFEEHCPNTFADALEMIYEEAGV